MVSKAMLHIGQLFPRSKRPPQHNWFFFFFAIPFGLVILGVEMTSNYSVVEWAFWLAWIFAVVTLWVALTILSRPARIIWSLTGGVIFGFFLLLLFWYLCPNLVVRPVKQAYRSSDDLYIFRVTNPTSTDLYANAFIFRLKPDTYSSNDLEVQIAPDSLKPLEQQSQESSEKMSDTFGISGEDSRGQPILIVYIYDLAPKDSRKIGIKFKGYIVPNFPVEVDAGIMSYSEIPLPIGKKEGDIVELPMGIELSLTIDRMFGCLLNTNNPSSEGCHFHQMRQPGHPEIGCYYLAFVKHRDLPNEIPPSPCDMQNFKTR